MHVVIWLAVLAVVLWVVAKVVAFITGALTTLLFVVIGVAVLAWVVGLLRARRRRGDGGADGMNPPNL